MRESQRNIIIDATPSINGIRAIQRYCHNLILEFDKVESELQFQLLYLGVKKDSLLPIQASSQITQVTSKIPGKILSPMWKYFNIPQISYFIKDAFELVHFPGGLPCIPNNCPKVLTTMHGFSSFFIPEFMNNTQVAKTKQEIEYTISKSTNFITVSETNKSEMLDLWGISPDKITAIPLGVSPEFQIYDLSDAEKRNVLTRYQLPDKQFILFVGALEPHKNIKNIILAYHQLPSKLKNKYQLVLVGKETKYCRQYKEEIISLGISDNVSFVDYIQPGSADLAYLYNMAELFVFPTFYEGWASPPVEAMKCGTPAIVSDIPSLRESTGGISQYSNPYDVKKIAENIEELLEDQILYKQQQTKGLEFVQQCTWKRCAKKTLALYKELIK